MKKVFSCVSIVIAFISVAYADSLNVRQIGSFQTSGVTQDVDVSGEHAYVSYFDTALRVIDVSDMANPVEVGSCSATQYYNPNGICASGSHVFLAYGFDKDSTGLSAINVTTPSSPHEVSFSPTDTRAHDVCVSGNYAYVPQCLGMRIFDVSTPSAPIPLGFCDISLLYHPQSVFVSGDHAYVGGTGSLRVINVKDPNKPFEVGSCDVEPYAWGVFVSGLYAYVAADTSGLRVIDVSDPANPHEVGSYNTPGNANAVCVSDGYAYVADDFAGLRVVDVSTPTNPEEVGFYETPNIALDVHASHPYAYVTCHSAGLRIYEYGEFPGTDENPVPFSLDVKTYCNRLDYNLPCTSRLTLYSVDGRRILETRIQDKGTWVAPTILSTGVYFARISLGSRSVQKRLLILK